VLGRAALPARRHHAAPALPSARLRCGRVLPSLGLTLASLAVGQNLRQALESRLWKLSAPSHSAVLLWDLPHSQAIAAVRPEMFAAPRCLGSLAWISTENHLPK